MDKQTDYKRNYISYNDYVAGSAVRKEQIQEVPQRKERTYVDDKRVTTSRRVYRNREKALQMTPSYVIVLALCTIAMCVVCAKYLSIKEEVSNKAKQITALEVQARDLAASNDRISYDINSFMDIEYITKVATEELGMQRATKEQIRYYKSSESEYMKQYKEIPAE